MAISSQLIGALGGSDVTEGRIWFTNGATREARQIQRTWTVPRGNYLFAWKGTLQSLYASGTNRVLVNGEPLTELHGSAATGSVVGGFTILSDVTAIVLSGEGTKRFEEDPYAAFVKIK